MSFSFHDAAAPAFIRGLTNLSALIDKAKASGVPEAEIMSARIAPDMHPFPRQIQIASDAAKGAMARLAGVEAPAMPDTETTLDELKARLAKTIAFVESIDAGKLEGADTRDIHLKLPSGEMTFSGRDFLAAFALPNLYFHSTVAYALLRGKGVQLGKMDFLGGPPR